MKFFDRFKVRLALSRAATQSAPVLQPAIEHVERQVVGTGRDWKASPAFKPMEWSEDIAAHNAAIDRIARIERLEMWADALQHIGPIGQGGIPHGTFQDAWNAVRALGYPIGQSEQLAAWAGRYFMVETAQLWSRRVNVTGQEKLLPRLTPEEIADARKASALASQVQEIERQRAQKSPKSQEDWLIAALGGEEEILRSCGGDLVKVEQVKAKAREMFAPAVVANS